MRSQTKPRHGQHPGTAVGFAIQQQRVDMMFAPGIAATDPNRSRPRVRRSREHGGDVTAQSLLPRTALSHLVDRSRDLWRWCVNRHEPRCGAAGQTSADAGRRGAPETSGL